MTFDLAPGVGAPAAPLQPDIDLPFLRRLAERGDEPAIVTDDRVLSYAHLDDLVGRAGALLGTRRQLLALAASNSVEFLTTYLAALRLGHVVLLVPPCRLAGLADAYRADLVVADGTAVRARRDSAHELHPDLGLLLSTSGSTGSPKTVRLSRSNLAANAEAVAAALGLTSADRAVTSLSPAYSYGLSVIHSHLSVGAALILTGASVTDPAFWRIAERGGATTLAGVPHTFALLDRMGFAGDALPDLRLMTCAGGPLPPTTARRYADLGARNGWGLALMYGQTEATARMACLPPELAAEYPQTVGWAIPGGEFALADVGPDGVGTLVYRGANVMMGYARGPADLARGGGPAHLDTGDRARFTGPGLLQIVGRDARFAKVFGLRIDLDEIERLLAERGIDAAAVEADGGITVVVEHADPTAVVRWVTDATGLPPLSIRAVPVADLPRVPNGKADRSAVAALAAEVAAPAAASGAAPAVAAVDPNADPQGRLCRVYAALLGREVAPTDSFVDVGGDSLSYVAVSVELERELGHLPIDWHRRAIADLAGTVTRRPVGGDGSAHLTGSPPRWTTLDVTVVLRALAIVAVVCLHAQVSDIRGGAHILMALAGVGMARFLLPDRDPARRLRTMLRSAGRILLPSLGWIGALALATSTYTWAALGAAWIVSPDQGTADWRYWFIGALLVILPVVALVVRVPAVETLRRRRPFAVPAVAAVLCWAAALVVLPPDGPSTTFSPLAVAWVFLLGWAVAEAGPDRLRLLASALVLALVPTALDDGRQFTVPLALLLVLWVPRVRLPVRLAGPIAAAAAASLVIYLSHWQVLDVLTGWPAVVTSLALGVLGWTLRPRRRERPPRPLRPAR